MTTFIRFCKLYAAVAVAALCAVQPASADPTIDLGRLFTNHPPGIASTGSNSANELVFQQVIWNIVNDSSRSYSLDGGDFTATSTHHDLGNNRLAQLDTASKNAFTANILAVQDTASTRAYAQEAAVIAPVPEPNTYAMWLAGLGIIVFTLRRRKQPRF